MNNLQSWYNEFMAPTDKLFQRQGDHAKEVLAKPFNSRKRRLCEVYIHSKKYIVYEYDLSDLIDIEYLTKAGVSELGIILTMLRKAIPDCPMYEIENLTQSESSELLTMIQSTATLSKLANLSSTSH